ncbi:MAG TPA: glycosyltransferase family 39 protein [Blastocatellia bacterium]|nr:glycosyltransferase family 39 protein [Blastocatellia bacterium]
MQDFTIPRVSVGKETDSKNGQGRRFTPKEAIPFLITVGLASLCYGLVINRGMGLPILGYNVSPAERVMLGEAPYRDFLYNYTPGVLWLNALLMKSLGASVMTINVGLFAFKLAALIALFHVARRLTSDMAALIPVALALAWIGYKVVFRAYPTQYSMLFLLLGIIFMLNYDKTGKARWLLMCGLTIGLVFLFKQNVGVFLLVSATAAIVIRESLGSSRQPLFPARILSSARKTAFCWAGFAVIAGAMFAYIANTGTLSAMLDHFFSLAGEYGEKRAIALPSVRLLGPVTGALLAVTVIGFMALRNAPRVFEYYVILAVVFAAIALLIPGRGFAIKNSATAAMFYLPPALFALSLAAVAWQFRSSRRGAEHNEDWWKSAGPIVIVGLFALAAYLEMYPRADYAHFVRMLPPVLLLLFLLIDRGVPALSTYFERYLPSPRRAALLCGAAPIALLFIVGIKDNWQPRFDASLRFIEQTPLAVERARGILVSRKQAKFIDDLAAAIEANSSPDEYIFSFAPRGTAFYFLNGRKNPSRFVWWRSVGIRSEERQALLDKIASGIPKLVFVSEGFHNERILDYINARYHQIEAVGELKVYDRNQ